MQSSYRDTSHLWVMALLVLLPNLLVQPPLLLETDCLRFRHHPDMDRAIEAVIEAGPVEEIAPSIVPPVRRDRLAFWHHRLQCPRVDHVAAACPMPRLTPWERASVGGP